MNKQILKTASLYTGFSIINQFIGLLVQLILMRGSTIIDYGEYAINFEALALIQLVLANAYRNYYLQKIREDNSHENINKLIYYQAINGSLLIFLFSSIVCYVYKLKLDVSIFLISVSVISSLILPLQAKWLANNERSKLIIKDISISLLSLVVVYITMRIMHYSVSVVTIFQYVGIGWVSLLLFIITAKGALKKIHYSEIRAISRTFDKKLYVFIMIFIVNALHNKFGGIFLRNFSTEIETSLYLTAFKFINPLFFIQTSLVSAFMPSFVRDKEFNFSGKVFLTFAVPGLLIALSLYFLFPDAIGFLGLKKYLGSYQIIKIACLFVFIVFIYGSMSNYISVTGGQRFILVTNVMALITLCLLSFVFKDIGNTSLNLIRVFVLVECLVCVLYYFYLLKKMKISFFFFLSPLICILLVFLSLF
ncbi:hypothetical protein ABCV45_001636 [Escherichia coli]|nr:hypothetical protein [Thomasclavelia sp.]EEW1635835.1 hypothetical protein [Escherichia coli]EFE9629050.1 hypothetical protein [Escherichia coli]EFM6344540.1 hypothetical protein [Escherichia coli]EFM7567525.1 hypothetical protein [Escherichia coli]EFO2538259.1 hypothetical protein [Escherichia coli]